MSSKIYDVVHKGDEFTAHDGSTKAQWTKIGAVFKSEKGSISMVLDYVPTRRNDQGKLFLNLFVPQDKKAAPAAPEKPAGGFREAPIDTGGPDGVGEDPIPF